jgi:hypothetical protein
MTEPEQLRDALEWRRDGDDVRAGGVPFEQAWPQSVAEVCKRSDDGQWWARVFEAQRPVWERAYNRERPTRVDTAIALLGEGRVAIGGPEVGHPCAFCDAEIPAARLKHHAEFCSEVCRKAASWERERARLAAA